MDNIEVELKFPLLNADETEHFLSTHGQFKYNSFQHDIYFNSPHRNFIAHMENVSEWLRVRITDNYAQINYKDYHPREEILKTHCTEYETKVESYEQISHILKAVNFVELIQVKKHRKSWDLEDVEISIDRVEDLGHFIEIEYKGTGTDITEILTHLHSFPSKINAHVGEMDNKGYPYLLLVKNYG